MKRCAWAKHPLEITYHDDEWGKPIFDDRHLFEALSLDIMQAGLNWLTILKKRTHFREAFDNFNIKKVAHYNDEKYYELLDNKGIIRNKLKIKAIINNAQCVLNIQKETGSFSNYLWAFVDFKTIDNQKKKSNNCPTDSEFSKNICKIMKAKGFQFIGPTIIYSFMEGAGMVNNHEKDCEFRS